MTRPTTAPTVAPTMVEVSVWARDGGSAAGAADQQAQTATAVRAALRYHNNPHPIRE